MARAGKNDSIIHDIRGALGLNADGTRNGNGLINETKTQGKRLDSLDKNILEIYKNMEHIETDTERKIEKMETNIKTIFEKHGEKIDGIERDIQDIKKSLEGNITKKTITTTLDTIKKYWWVLLLLLGNFATQIVSALKSFGVIP